MSALHKTNRPCHDLYSRGVLLALYTLLFFLVGFAASVKIVAKTSCQPGWFGSVCQFKCRCRNNQCDQSGQCPGNVRCQLGWFGPACQYADLASADGVFAVLTDGDDETCFNMTVSRVQILVNNKFTWLRVHVREPGALVNLTFEIRKINFKAYCRSSLQVPVDDRTLDFYCSIDGDVYSVYIRGPNLASLCSVYVSGGRNLAIKQNATQSSTYTAPSGNDTLSFPAELAVDGDTSADLFRYRTCIHTGDSPNTPGSWTLRLSPPAIVNRYVIYNRADGFSDRLRGFFLQSYRINGSRTLNFHDHEKASQLIYTVTHDPKVVAMVLITTNHSSKILHICEVEVYGEMVCDVGKYGLECDKDCNCFLQEDCLPANGFCSTGCASGYIGHNCGSRCSPGMYGLYCQYTCTPMCVTDNSTESPCHHETGYCLHGCQLGYDTPKCERRCPPDRFGRRCDSRCSPACKKPSNKTAESICDKLNGTCLHGCDIGYRGSTCSTACGPNKYGVNCEQICSRGCLEVSLPKLSVCNHINGSCVHGCRSGYNGTQCRRDEMLSSHGYTKMKSRAWIIFALAVGILWAIALVLVAVCVQKKRTTISEETRN